MIDDLEEICIDYGKGIPLHRYSSDINTGSKLHLSTASFLSPTEEILFGISIHRVKLPRFRFWFI